MMRDYPGNGVSGLFSLIQNLSMEVINGRVRMRALLELLEEKGILLPDEYESRGQAVWERDYEELAAELFGLPSDDEDEGAYEEPVIGDWLDRGT